jgi:hypothetical protein
VDLLGVDDLSVGGHGADRQATVVTAHVAEARNTSDVHQKHRLRQAQLHERQKTVPTRNDFGLRIIEKANCILK